MKRYTILIRARKQVRLLRENLEKQIALINKLDVKLTSDIKLERKK